MASNATPADEAQHVDSHARARESISRIFEVLNIAKVVYVDDIFETNGWQLNSLIGLLQVAVTDHLPKLTELFPEISLGADVDVWDPQVRTWWEETSEDERARIITAVSSLTGNKVVGLDYEAARTLEGILPEDLPLMEVAPSLWDQGYLAGAEADARVLCLIDREFTYSTGLLPEQIKDGTDILATAVADQANEEVIFALFSHTFSAGAELERWREIATEKGLELDRFLPFSKRRQDVIEFAIQLEMVVLNMFCERLKRTATTSWAHAHSEAAAQFRDLNPYEFEKMVLESSWREGTWEPDILLRIFQIFHRDAARAVISRTETAERVNTDAMLARKISECRVREPDIPSEQRWTIRHRELYEDREALNLSHAPLRTGDLFIDNERRTYILFAQPCDLAVRTDSGSRKNRHVALVRVEVLTKIKLDRYRKKTLDKGHDYLQTRGILPYFTQGKDDLGLVRFADAHSVAADLLDLAVLHDDGRCRVEPRQNWTAPPQISIGWRQRAQLLRDEFKNLAEKLDRQHAALAAVGADDRGAIWQALMPALSPAEMKLPPIPYIEGVFDFGLQRVGHLREPGATRLLASYTRYLSRDAEEVDFGL